MLEYEKCGVSGDQDESNWGRSLWTLLPFANAHISFRLALFIYPQETELYKYYYNWGLGFQLRPYEQNISPVNHVAPPIQ